MTSSTRVYTVFAITLHLLLTIGSCSIVASEIHPAVRANSAELHRRDNQAIARFQALGGLISYQGQNFPRETHSSPREATVAITKRVRDGNIGSVADQDILPRGYDEFRGAKWHRCHLIAKALGGSGNDARNFFACHAFANTPVMRHYEGLLRKYLDVPTRVAIYTVKLRYINGQGYPDLIHLRATTGNHQTVLFDVTIPNEPEASIFVDVCDNGILTANRNRFGNKPINRKLLPHQNTKWAYIPCV